MALRFDLSGNPLPGPVDRLRGSVMRHLEASATDPRDAEIAALKARVAELETALRQSQSQSQSQSHAPVSVSQSQKNKQASTQSAAKPKDEPWTALGLSKATYYRRKAAGVL